MSNICVVDLKEHNLDFKLYNQLAKKIVQYSLDNDLAVFFNSYDYNTELIYEVGMKDFFIMSDSFIYKQADFLDTADMFLDRDIDKFRTEFYSRFNFFKEIVGILFGFGLSNIDIYFDISNSGSIEDFINIKTSQNNLLSDLFESLLKYSDEYAYGFPTLKIEITIN